jgi:hypothetical protein
MALITQKKEKIASSKPCSINTRDIEDADIFYNLLMFGSLTSPALPGDVLVSKPSS